MIAKPTNPSEKADIQPTTLHSDFLFAAMHIGPLTVPANYLYGQNGLQAFDLCSVRICRVCVFVYVCTSQCTNSRKCRKCKGLSYYFY